MSDFEIINPKINSESEEKLMQLLAVFIRRFGGEVLITQREFDMVEGLPLLANYTTPEHLRVRLVEEHEICEDCGDIHLDDA